MLSLRTYQDWQRHEVMARWAEGYRSVCLVSPTGSGKRYLALWFCQYAHQHGRRVLFVGNRRLLITQAQNDAERFDIPFGVIMADSMGGDPGSTNQIASIQTLESWYFYEKFTGLATGAGLPPADLVIVDEGHSDLRRVGMLLSFYPQAKFLILTATPVGPEGCALVPNPYETLVEVRAALNSELIRQGLLLPTTVLAPSEPDIEGVKVVKKQEYNQNQLGRKVQECTVFADVFNEWAPFADRATVCFTPGVAFAQDLASQFNRRLGGGQAYVIEAKTKPQEREDIFKRIEQGEAKLLVSVDVLREGWDMPVISCGIDLQPNSQLRTYWQKVGRVKRAYEGQTEAVWLDLAGNYWRFPHPDEDPQWPVGDETTQDVIKRNRKAAGEREPVPCPKCHIPFKVATRPPKCPACGFVIEGEPKRRIRMGNGKLKEVPAWAKEKKQKTEAEKKLGVWQSCLFAGLKKNWPLSRCAGLYQTKTGEWPADGWPGTFPKGTLDWKRTVPNLMSGKEIAMMTRRRA